MAQHSDAFLAVRDLLLGLDDADRRRLTGLYGAMKEPQPDPGVALLTVLRAIAALEDADHIRLARWIRRYVNKWGQIPVASSRLVKPSTEIKTKGETAG